MSLDSLTEQALLRGGDDTAISGKADSPSEQRPLTPLDFLRLPARFPSVYSSAIKTCHSGDQSVDIADKTDTQAGRLSSRTEQCNNSATFAK